MSYELSNLDYPHTLKAAFEDNTGLLGVINGFIFSKVGRKITVTYPTDTREIYTFLENDTTIFVLQIDYTDTTKNYTSSIERTA